MKTKLPAVPTVLFASAAFLGACSSNEPGPVETQATRSVPMTESSDVAGHVGMVYRASNVNPRQYTRFIVEPVQIYRGADADFGGATEQQKQQMAAFMQSELVRALGNRVTTTPGPNVARMKVTLAGLEGNIPVAATASRLLPVGLVANVVQSARGEPGSFTGSVTYAAEVVDSMTGRPIVVAVQKRSPDAMDIGATLSSQEAQKAAITSVADAFRKKIDELQSASGAPRS
ncbi:MAG TPA: DUF3313 domain-containing protein [Alphaproteobacteria bacterium]